MSSESTEQPPKYTYTPFPQTTTVHPLRPYHVPQDTDHYYTPFGNATNSKEDRNDDMTDMDSQSTLKEMASFGFVKYLSVAISHPFEVAKTLLQIQYLPNEDVIDIPEVSLGTNGSEEDVDEDEDDEFSARSSQSLDPSSPGFRKTKSSDSQGYLTTNVYDESTRPKYMLPPLKNGVWSTLGTLKNHNTEGFGSLWKGQFVSWLYDMGHLFLQPTLESALNDAFDLYDDTIPLIYLDHVGPNIATLVTSHLVVGVLLSPLEVVQTRLIVQTSSPIHKKYSGTLDCLRKMIKEEGLSSLYWSHNLLPSIIYHTICPLLECTVPLIIDRVFHISPSDSPFLYGLAQLGLDTLQLLITLPLQTIRKRLQCQIRSRTPGKSFETIVQTRKAPYIGMLDAIYRIIIEEGVSQRYVPMRGSSQKRRGQRGLLDSYGIRGLYHGFYIHFTTNVTTFLFRAMNGVEDEFEKY
ncbi:7005_t:CDS:2 [Funneliformis caledonium]|uniref:7005_t:CDS:1 n=1 Tax=Funneliformis caledonium TaxID=1117310 RepID=A0A9N8W9V7_9GLOM|nr:7005_t:CDS:2 [Funneliformis caledonium]